MFKDISYSSDGEEKLTADHFFSPAYYSSISRESLCYKASSNSWRLESGLSGIFERT